MRKILEPSLGVTQGKHEGATSRSDQTGHLRKRSRTCLGSPHRYESNLGITVSFAAASGTETDSVE